MIYLKKFKSQAEGIGYIAPTPFVSIVDGVDNKVLYAPESIGNEIEIIDDGDGFIKYEIPAQNSVLLYTSKTNNILTFTNEDFDKTILSHTYSDGYGRVVFEGELTSIGTQVFKNIQDLTSVIIPEGVLSIGLESFHSCRSLTSVTLPSTLTTIGNSAFAQAGITSIELPESITSIGNYAFYMSKLTGVTLFDDVTIYGENVYRGTNITNITIPETWTYIPKTMFAYTQISTVTIPASVQTIMSEAFMGAKLTTIVIPSTVLTTKSYVFRSCGNLNSVTFETGSSINLGEWMFDACSGLTTITLPDNCTSVGQQMFRNCTALTEMHIPAGVVSIGSKIAIGCTALTDIYFEGTTQPTIQSTSFSEIGSTGGTLHVPTGSDYTNVLTQLGDGWVISYE